MGQTNLATQLVAEDHHQHQNENGLDNFCGSGAGEKRCTIEEDRAEAEGDQAQGELLQDRRAEAGVLAGETQLRLDEFLPSVEVLLDLAGEDFAELGVDAADVRGQRLNQDQQNDEENEERGHGCLTFAARSMRPCGKPSFVRRSRSRRAILPLSDSWSWPARWSRPWRMRTLISVKSE